MRRATAVTATGLAAIALLGVTRPRGLADVVEVRHWSYPDYTRVVVETSKPIDMKTAVQRLPADRKARRPERLYVDLGGLWVGRRYLEGIKLGDGLLQGVRLGQYTLRTTRLVLDLQKYERHRLFTLKHPDRVVIDVYGERRRPLRRPSELPLGQGTPPPYTVVLDAGHGGRDPGAIGVGGAREKTVTLKIAKALGRALGDRGFEVLYTREDDRTISLEERTAIAEAARADLFVSIHTNASSRRSVHGIETYYLDKDNQRHSLTVAARENGITRDQVDDLQRTLAKLRVSELSVFSKRLASVVQEELVSGLAKRYTVTDLGVKKGPFYVLFLSDTPAILVEVGFISNRKEAHRLRSVDYVDALAKNMAIGLDRYRSGVTTMARRQP